MAEHLFDRLDVDRFLLEYDSELVGGFGGSADNAFMTPDEQWKKLELIVRVADRVWSF